MTLQSDFTRADRVADRMTDTMVKKQLLPAYKQSLDSIRGDLALLYEKYSKDGVLRMADVSKYNRLRTLEADIAKEMSRLGVKQIGVTSHTIKDVYQESYYRAAFALEKEAQVKLRFGQLPAKQVEAALVNPMDRIGWKDRTKEQAALSTRQIKEEITRGIIQGKCYPDVARSVKERMDIAAGRAERIVRTEAHRARTMGTLDSLHHAERIGVELTYIWSAAIDDRTRSSHADMDSREANKDNLFEFPDGTLVEGPGLHPDPAESINCRCALRANVSGMAPELRRVRGAGVVQYQSYHQWYEARIVK
jgi:SPP1 gp7 family putative phage head morphogenesis protein